MKVNEVPQDPKDFREGAKVKKVIYAVDDDGKYTSVNSAGWEAENFATKQAWDAIDEELAETAEKVKAGELSPIAYYMHKCLMEPSLLAKYVGKWQWQVNKHMKPSGFNKLSADMLSKYAKAFNITIEELTSFGK
ncbi:MAG: hypothetical protein JST82_10585 [Bacteroidetes bacterium]|nr:hypothetical protein [Bacteroidota bacterium]